MVAVRMASDGGTWARTTADLRTAPARYWLALATLVLVQPHLAQAGGLGMGLLVLNSLAGLVAAGLLLRRRWLGWQMARVVALVASIGSGLVFLSCLSSLEPGPGVTLLVLAIGLGTVAWVTLYQQLEHPQLLAWLRRPAA